ncbi:MAG: hypothetical protein V4556_00160 [Bacteroidota bacterium]
MESLVNNQYTYNEGRKCLHCNTPLADQFHESRKFCFRTELTDGTVQSCKDDYHSPIRKSNYEPFKKIFDFHKEIHENITQLFNAKGELVSLEEINLFGIPLSRAFETEVNNLKNQTYRFVEFEFQLLNKKQFKLVRHGKIF